MKATLFAIVMLAVTNAKYGSLWIDDDEDQLVQTVSPLADDILLLDSKAAK